MSRKRIAFITSDPNSIYAQRLLKGVFNQSRVYGFDVLVFTSMVQVGHFQKEYLEGELNIYELIRSPEIDGMIIDTVSLTVDHIESAREKLLGIVQDIPEKPIVSIDMSFGGNEIVCTNDTAAFEQITRHIIETHGCKDICFLSGPKEDDVPVKRLEGFRKAMQSCGLPVNENRIFYGIYWYSYGEEIADRVANGEIALPEAFICSTDYIAIGLVNRLAKHGIRVPEDVLVTGFDASAEAAFNDPTITTYIPLSAHTAAEAVNIIAERIAPELGRRPVALSSGENLITCRSCGCKDNKDEIIDQFDLSLMMKNPNFGEESVRDEINLNRLLGSYMPEQINSAETSDQCIKNIYLHVYLLKPYERFCLCLREDWGDHESVFEKGYPDRMKLVFDTRKESFVCSDTDGVLYDTSMLLPYLDDSGSEPAVYYFTSVHYIKNALGYAVLKRRLDEKKGLDEVFSLWLRNIETSLEMIRVRNKLTSFSERDAMTGLYNRRGMDRWIKDKLRTDEDAAATVFIIDMDGLKYVNDNFGHKEGDLAIRAIGAALQSVETENEVVARIGGDEFCVISISGTTAEEKTKQISSAIERANALADKPYTISASIGHASGKLQPDILDKLIPKADEEMYLNKKKKNSKDAKTYRFKQKENAMYKAADNRYDKMIYRKCGRSGLKLPAISLGLWQNFGFGSVIANAENMCRTAFDLGITHFDLANNYGHPYNGSAEENFGKILDRGLRSYRDELCISTKAGYEMWEGPYGDRNGSRKYLIASLDQSLKRMGLDYVDIYYHHIFDPNTPLEETALALDHIVRQGKALYVGVSNYRREQSAEIAAIFKELKTPFIVNQPSYSMLNRWIEDDGLDKWAEENGVGISVFSPLYQGFLTDRYLKGIPEDSRVGKGNTWIGSQLTDEMVKKLNKLNDIAQSRGQKLSQMAIAWILHNPAVTTVLIGASRPEQIADNVKAVENLDFSDDEIDEIEKIISE